MKNTDFTIAFAINKLFITTKKHFSKNMTQLLRSMDFRFSKING